MFHLKLVTLIATTLILLAPRAVNTRASAPVPVIPLAEPGTPVSVTARTSDTMDMIVVGADGKVNRTNWDASSGWSKQAVPLQDKVFADGFTAPPKSGITAVSRTPDSLNLFVVGYDGRIFTGSWDASNGWAKQWIPL